jgi:hypothetical protein
MREPPGDGTVVALMFGDFFAGAVGGLSLLLGFFWWPGYIVGLGVVAWLIMRVSKRRTEYWCRNCQRSWPYAELSRSRRSSAL